MGTAMPGQAADCGQSIPCACGDTVVSDYTLPADLGPCPDHGLLLSDGVLLDGAGHTISGSASGDPVYGLYVRNVNDVTIRDVRVTGFRHGLRLRDARRTEVLDSEFFANGQSGVGYGIDLALGSSNNTLRGNRVYQNADEGVHFGSGCDGNLFEENEVFDNVRENVYLLSASNHTLRANLLEGGRDSFFVKDSSTNLIENNIIRDGTLVLRGDATDNLVRNNTIEAAGVRIQVYDKDVLPRFPSNNRVEGGSITHSGTCLRFESTSGNVIAETTLADCQTELRSDGILAPSENTVVGLPLRTNRLDLDGASTVQQMWDLGVAVQNSGGGPVDDATVTATNATPELLFEETTGPGGEIAARPLLGSTLTGNSETDYTPFTFVAVAEGSPPASRTINPNASGMVVLSLDTPPPPNQSPVADLEGDAVGLVGFSVSFSARESFDPDGDALSYLWDFGEGPATSGNAEETHTYSGAGTFTVRVTVDDGTATDTAETTVEIRIPDPLNDPPNVDAGEDFTVDVGEIVPLAGSTSDDGRPTTAAGLTSRWSILSSAKTVELDDETSPTSTAVFTAPGTYVLQLAADDGERQTDDRVVITVVRPAQSEVLYNDFAVSKLKVPKRVMLTDSKPVGEVRVKAQIQNQGETTITIESQETIEEMLDFDLESLGSCPEPEVTIVPRVREFPVQLKPRAKLSLNLLVQIDCVNDPAKTSRDDPAREDFRCKLRVDREVTDGFTDDDPSDDACPRQVTAPYRADWTWHNGLIRDRGCGNRLPDRTLGGEILLDVVDRRSSTP
jgi:parallel beta-helix repeat protein